MRVCDFFARLEFFHIKSLCVLSLLFSLNFAFTIFLEFIPTIGIKVLVQDGEKFWREIRVGVIQW